MKIELLIFAITAFLVVNTYYDGKYLKILQSWQKYFKMATIGFMGLSLYLFIRKNPVQSKNMLSHANDIIKYMPVDKSAADMFTPFLDFSNQKSFFGSNPQNNMAPQHKRMMNSGKTSTKRCVSETKKKFVAAQQSWKCGDCKQQLPGWFEVDHKIRLENGGSNHVDNLVALCRDCHGKKNSDGNLLKTFLII